MAVRLLGTSYGAPALAALHEVVADHKRTDPLAAVTVVVPNTVAGTVVRRHLARVFAPAPFPAPSVPASEQRTRPPGDPGQVTTPVTESVRTPVTESVRTPVTKPVATPTTIPVTGPVTGIAGIYLTTLARLAEQLAAPAMAGRRPATGAIVSAAWRAALDADPGGVFTPVKDHPATVTALLRAHRDLRDLTGEQLDAVAGAGVLAGAVVGLHRAVTATLQPVLLRRVRPATRRQQTRRRRPRSARRVRPGRAVPSAGPDQCRNGAGFGDRRRSGL